MIALERSPQDLSEAILTSLGPCEEIVKFCHILLVLIMKLIKTQYVKNKSFEEQ